MDYQVQPPPLAEKVDSIGRQLLGALKDPEGKFQYAGMNEPLRAWCQQHGVNYQPPS